MCLCAALPEELITLHGKFAILQHPCGSKQARKTVPHIKVSECMVE